MEAETRSEATLISQANDVDGLDQDGRLRSGHNYSDFGYDLKMKGRTSKFSD